jgi:APA family basic amino acid/polyamine antiporter
MADAAALPPVLTRLGGKTRAPYVAIGVATVVAAGFLALGDLDLIAGVTDFAVYLVFVAVNVSVIVLRFREPERARPFRAPGSIRRIPILPVLGLATVVTMLPALPWEALLVGTASCAVGLGSFALLRHRRPDVAGDAPNAAS